MTDTRHTLLLSLWRTFVPYLVGFGIAIAARYGFDIDEASLTSLLTLVAGTLYYAAARWLEQNRSARWGWLIGYTKSPVYARGRHRSVEPTATGDAA